MSSYPNLRSALGCLTGVRVELLRLAEGQPTDALTGSTTCRFGGGGGGGSAILYEGQPNDSGAGGGGATSSGGSTKEGGWRSGLHAGQPIDSVA